MATKTCFSPNYIDVNAVINGGTDSQGVSWPGVADGDTVIVPPGTAHWTGTQSLSITKGITLQGQTTVTNAGLSNVSANDQTVIINDVTGAPNLINVTIKSTQRFQLTGFTLQAGTASGTTMLILGSTGTAPITDLQVDHCHIKGFSGRAVWVSGCVFGVAHHNWLEAVAGGQTFYIHHPTYVEVGGSGTRALGHGSWADYPWFGTERFFFIENNTMRGIPGPNRITTSGATDSENGGRWVYRYNYCYDCRPGWHGTEGGNRGCRAVEIYNNIFNWSVAFSASNRSGVAFYHDNTWLTTGSNSDHHSSIVVYREEAGVAAGCPYGFADGTGPFDKNDTEGNGTFVEGHSPHVYDTGTVTTGNTGSGSPVTITVSGKSWTTNQWAGFSIKQTTAVGAPSYPKGSFIISNTANTITFSRYTSGDRGPALSFAAGDTYAIRKVLKALDQSGQGKGDLLSGSSPVVNTVAGHTWAHQALEPCLSWNNSFGSTAYGFGGGHPTTVEGVDFYNLGRGHPTTGAIPTAYTGPAYNSGLNGSAYTAPYTYPHPITLGVAITSVNHTQFTVGQSNSFQFNTSGFSSSPTFSSTGTLPTGSSLSSGGLLSMSSGATPTTGDYTITVTATAGSQNASQSFTITVVGSVSRVITLSVSSLAFGNVDVNTSATRSFTITNSGNSTLTVTAVSAPSGYSVNWTSGTIAQGATQAVTVTFSPTAASSYTGNITVTSNATSGSNTIAVSGTGATRIMALSGDLAFGNVTTGQTATRTLTVTNNGNVALALTSVTYPQGFSGDFSSGSIAAGGSQAIHVSFAPTAAQAYSGNVDLVSNKTSGTSTIGASGTGTASATKVIQLTGNLDFGNVQTGTTVTRVLTITNSGNATLAVSGITYPSGFTGAFSGNISAGASQNVNVVFSPVAATTYSGTVTVASDATGGINTTTASGTGVTPSTKVIGLSGNLAFGNVVIGSSPTRTLTITNTGSALLTVSGITYPTGYSGAYSGTIAPGASHDVTVTFSPSGVQDYNGTITVASDSTSGTNTIAASGSGVAASTKIIGVSGDLAFGNVQKHHSAQRIMIIANTGTAALAVSGITLPTGFSANWTSGSIVPGASQSVTVTFNPTDAASYGGTITVASNKTSGVNTIACSGTGTNKKQVPFFLIVG